MKQYHSFKDIDNDLRRLKLEAEISKQKANIDLVHLKRAFAFPTLAAELISFFGQKAVYAKLGRQLLKKFGLK